MEKLTFKKIMPAKVVADISVVEQEHLQKAKAILKSAAHRILDQAEEHPMSEVLTPEERAEQIVSVPSLTGHLAKLTKKFLFAGRAVFTVNNNKGDHYTFKVRGTNRAVDGKPLLRTIYFMSVKLEGGKWPYRYVGMLNPDTGFIKITGKSEFKTTDKPYLTAAWACQVVVSGKLIPDGYEIQHAGQCGKCGKALTDPVSIERGIGPDCWSRLA